MTGPLPRLTVALTFDPDGQSDGIRRGDPANDLYRGEFGVRIAIPRLLALLEREGITCTWFVPGHTLVSFPDSIAAVLAAGHEIAAHGWYHEDFATPLGRGAAGDSRARAKRRHKDQLIAPDWAAPPLASRQPSASRRPALVCTA